LTKKNLQIADNGMTISFLRRSKDSNNARKRKSARPAFSKKRREVNMYMAA